MKINLQNQFIYELLDPETREVRYVGFTGNPIQRLKSHCKEALDYCKDPASPGLSNKAKHEWIAFLLGNNTAPIMRVIEECPKDCVRRREFFWMETRYNEGCNLLNNTADIKRLRAMTAGDVLANLVVEYDDVVIYNGQ